MNVCRLILREISHRRLQFSLGIFGVLIAAGVLVAQVFFLHNHDRITEQTLQENEQATEHMLQEHDQTTQHMLQEHDQATQKILAAREKEMKAMMQKLEDDVRKITVNMGFNVLILPQGQQLTGLYDDQVEPRTMPESYAEKLAQSRVATINHVLPSLTRRIKWPERQRKIMLMGVRGEVLIHGAKQKPILEAVSPGQMVVGHELHRSMNLTKGQKVTLMGQEFTISNLLGERGNWDDATVWIDLHQAQKLLGQTGQINAILALECNCSTNRLAEIRKEIGALLPDTQVIEFASQAIARAEARNRAREHAEATLKQEALNRQQMGQEIAAYRQEMRKRLTIYRQKVQQQAAADRQESRHERESLAAVLVPVVLLAGGMWVALVAFGNVRERRPEIALYRALGLRTYQILLLFLGRAGVIGLVGGSLGYLAGTIAGTFGGGTRALQPLEISWNPWLLAGVMVAGPLLAVLFSWIPAFLAAQQDPAVALQSE